MTTPDIPTLPESEFFVSAEKMLLDLDMIHAFLARSYWSPGIPRLAVERAVAGSMCFGIYQPACAGARPRQVGFARVITDGATFAYLADVFIVESFRGRGLGKRLSGVVMARPELQGLRRFMLLTRDAHALYEQFGFAACATPDRVMERRDPEAYKSHARWAADAGRV